MTGELQSAGIADPTFETAPNVPELTPESWRQVPGAPMSFRLFLGLLSKLEIGTLTLVLPDGQCLRTRPRQPGPHGVLLVRNYRCFARSLKGGNVGFAESYLDGDWDSPDPSTLIEVLSSNNRHLRGVLQARGLTRFALNLVHRIKKNTKEGSKRNIHAHYDLGNQFYSTWLDPTMTYSSARFHQPGEDLAAAQINKYRSLAQRLDLKPDHSVLEIGCGWGGFAEFAAKEVGCKVTGITISKEQLDFAKRRIFEQGLNERVDLRFQDYRDVNDQYDRVASIEMFEAVGEEYWPTFFRKVRDSLKEGGRAGLQIITIADELFDQYRRGTDFIQRYIFPGGMLPSPMALKQQIEASGLNWIEDMSFGRDYARTLGAWRARFIEAWPNIEPLGFDRRFARIWKLYLSYCEGGFRAGSINVMQIGVGKS